MELTIGKLSGPHGIKGELKILLSTDDPVSRLTPGRVFATQPPQAGPLTLASWRQVSGRDVVAFQGVDSRTMAENLRGVALVITVEETVTSPQERKNPIHDDSYYRHELVGLQVLDQSGQKVGVVCDLEIGVGQDRLVVQTPKGQVQVPFVKAIVPVVDLAAQQIILDPPAGLI